MQSIRDYFLEKTLRMAGLSKLGAMVAGLLVFFLTLWRVVWPSLGELQEMWQQGRQQRAKLEQLQEFAALHADYGAYEEAKYKELVQLKQRLQQLGDSNHLQGQLQLLAVKQGLVVKNMQVLPDAPSPQAIGTRGNYKGKKTPADRTKAATLKNMGLKLELVGDYFALLRWLRQVEKRQLALETIQIKGQGTGTVTASLVLRCPLLDL